MTSPSTQYDLFISYARSDLEQVRPLVEALEESGLTVWFDANPVAIVDFESILATLENGVARSRALLAYYSHAYPTRRACQFELTAAYLAAEREGDPRRRILVINPEADWNHVEPAELRDARSLVAPDVGDEAALAKVVRAVTMHLNTLAGTLGTIAMRVRPPWYGRQPTGSTRFVGRTRSMWEAHHALHSSQLAVLTSATGAGIAQIVGLAGIGKTLLAEEYALRYGAAYPGGIYWVNAGGADGDDKPEHRHRVEHQLRGLAARRGLDVQDVLTHAEIQGALAAAIESQGQPCLWVVDDVPLRLTEPEINQWLAPHPLASTLLTTRSRNYGALASAVEPGVLEEREAIELLARHRMPESDDEAEEARLLAAALGCHALAIDVAGAHLSSYTGSYHDYRMALADPAADVLELAASFADVLPAGHRASIAGTLLSSIRSMSGDGLDFLRLASLLSPEPISDGLIELVFSAAHGKDMKIGRLRASRGINEAHSRSLTDLADYTARARTVHLLISRTVRYHLPDTEGQTQRLRAAAILVLTNVCDDLEVETRPFARAEVEHARHLAGRAETFEEGHLLAAVAHDDHELGAYKSAARALETVLGTVRRLRGDDDDNTLRVMNEYANTLYAQGDLAQARLLQESVLQARTRRLGRRHVDTAHAMVGLAATLAGEGDVHGACALQEEALGVIRHTLGPDHRDALQVMNNLGTSLHALGDFDGARALFEEALATAERLGQHAARTAHVRVNLAEALRSLGENARAISLLEETLETVEQFHGPEHDVTLTLLHHLATLKGEDGDLIGAKDIEQEVVAIRRRTLGAEHDATLVSELSLATTLSELGDAAAARALQEHAFAGFRERRGAEHPDTLGAASNLAATLREQGELVRARELQENVVAASIRVLGADHPNTLTATSQLALTLGAQSEYAAARALLEKVVSGLRRLHGENHPATLLALANLAAITLEEGDTASARALQEETLNRMRRVLGEDHPTTVDAKANLGELLYRGGDFASARSLFEESYATISRQRGRTHRRVVGLLSSLAMAARSEGDLDAALGFGEELVDVLTALGGDEDPETLEAKGATAWILHEQGDFERARLLQEEVLAVTLRQVGRVHERTLRATDRLAETMRASGDYERAVVLHQQSVEAHIELHGDRHFSTLDAKLELAVALRDHREYQRAIELFEEIAATLVDIVGDGHPAVLHCEAEIATTRSAEDDVGGAA